MKCLFVTIIVAQRGLVGMLVVAHYVLQKCREIQQQFSNYEHITSTRVAAVVTMEEMICSKVQKKKKKHFIYQNPLNRTRTIKTMKKLYRFSAQIVNTTLVESQ